jgi:hypothetical protein
MFPLKPTADLGQGSVVDLFSAKRTDVYRELTRTTKTRNLVPTIRWYRTPNDAVISRFFGESCAELLRLRKCQSFHFEDGDIYPDHFHDQTRDGEIEVAAFSPS